MGCRTQGAQPPILNRAAWPQACHSSEGARGNGGLACRPQLRPHLRVLTAEGATRPPGSAVRSHSSHSGSAEQRSGGGLMPYHTISRRLREAPQLLHTPPAHQLHILNTCTALSEPAQPQPGSMTSPLLHLLGRRTTQRRVRPQLALEGAHAAPSVDAAAPPRHQPRQDAAPPRHRLQAAELSLFPCHRLLLSRLCSTSPWVWALLCPLPKMMGCHSTGVRTCPDLESESAEHADAIRTFVLIFVDGATCRGMATCDPVA